MPPYSWIHFESFLFMMGIGLALSFAILLARGSDLFTFSFRKQSEAQLEESLHEFGGEVKEYNKPTPLFIWLVFLGYFLWATAYVIYCGYYGL